MMSFSEKAALERDQLSLVVDPLGASQRQLRQRYTTRPFAIANFKDGNIASSFIGPTFVTR